MAEWFYSTFYSGSPATITISSGKKMMDVETASLHSLDSASSSTHDLSLVEVSPVSDELQESDGSNVNPSM